MSDTREEFRHEDREYACNNEHCDDCGMSHEVKGVVDNGRWYPLDDDDLLCPECQREMSY